MYRASRGFTLIEVLITIAILMVLAAMAFIGFKVLGTGGKTNTTKTALESCKSMVTELEVSGGLKQVQALYPNGFPPVQSPAVPEPVPAPRNVTMDAYDGGTHDRYGENSGTPDHGLAVRNTQLVMQKLLAAPRNQTIFGQLPTERLLTKPAVVPSSGWSGIKFDWTGTNATFQPKPPILVDAWNNPIIYVPAAGLSEVTVAGTANRVITSARVRGLYNAGDTDPSSLTYGNIDPGATGFWASAGPDGDFSKGDDNIYSFEN